MPRPKDPNRKTPPQRFTLPSPRSAWAPSRTRHTAGVELCGIKKCAQNGPK